MTKNMKVVALTGIREITILDQPMPEIINENDVLIKVKSVGVCGSDVHYYKTGRIGSQVVKYPFVVGHEGAGIVIKTGKNVTRVKEGDKIAIEPAMPCFQCDQCKNGRHNTCRNLKFLGCPGQASGCLSEYIVMPESSCIPFYSDISFAEAVISEPLAIGLYAVKLAGDTNNKDIAILGYGPIGMSVHYALKIQGHGKIFVSDLLDYRLHISTMIGSIYIGNPNYENIEEKFLQKLPNGFDIIFECCGKQEAINNSLQLLKPGGKILLIGIPEFDNWVFNADLIRRKEISILNVRRQNHCAERAVDLIDKKIINVKPIITHQFNYIDSRKAFETVMNYLDKVMKAIINFD